jgi:hypothetical protein
MKQQVDAIYEQEALRPVVPLSPPDHAHVKLTVDATVAMASTEPKGDDWEQQLANVARDCGVSLPNDAASSEGIYE